MKYCLIITSLLITHFQSYGQRDSTNFFFDEFNASINRTLFLTGEHTGDKFGFGIGMYRSIMSQKRINLTFGFEYNFTRQFIKKTYEGRFAHATDLTYSLNNLSVPFLIRFNIGNKTKVFIEAGAFSDMILWANRKGIMHSYAPDGNNMVVYKTSDFNEKANLSSINYGFTVGLGIKIPFDKFELVIKPDYKLGLHELDSYRTSILNSYVRLTVGLKKKN